MKRLVIILLLASACFGDTYTSHQKPITDNTLDIGTSSLFWRYIYAHNFGDGTAIWSGNTLSGFDSISGTTLTDGTFIVTGGVITTGIWQGTNIDISDYTSLIAGTNISLFSGPAGDTLGVDDAFLVNDTDDVTTGTLTMAGLIVTDTQTPSSTSSTGTTGTIAWDSSYIYVCVATNSWLRSSLAAWGDNLLLETGDALLNEDGDNMILD